jgi:hypothetical protein
MNVRPIVVRNFAASSGRSANFDSIPPAAFSTTARTVTSFPCTLGSAAASMSSRNFTVASDSPRRCSASDRCDASATRALSAARCCRRAFTSPTVVPTIPSTSAASTSPAATIVPRLRRTNLLARYAVLGGAAEIASPARYRRMSRAIALAESYRRERSFSIAFITIQSSSPRTVVASRRVSPRAGAGAWNVPPAICVSLALGAGGSTSRMIRCTSAYEPDRSTLLENGVVPVRSSYSITPRAYTSLRVSMSSEPSACSGLMYSGVPMSARCSVNSVRSVSFAAVALAIPKSMTLGAARPSWADTSTLLGLRSRWITPLVCACWTASQTHASSSSRSRTPTPLREQYSTMGSPLTSSITKNGRPVSVAPASSTFAMPGWSMSASA